MGEVKKKSASENVSKIKYVSRKGKWQNIKNRKTNIITDMNDKMKYKCALCVT